MLKAELEEGHEVDVTIDCIGSTLRSRAPAVKAEILASIVRDVFPKIEAGLVKPTIYKVPPSPRQRRLTRHSRGARTSARS